LFNFLTFLNPPFSRKGEAYFLYESVMNCLIIIASFHLVADVFFQMDRTEIHLFLFVKIEPNLYIEITLFGLI